MGKPSGTVLSNVDMLTARLQRIEFLLMGDTELQHSDKKWNDDQIESALERMNRLENELQNLSAQSKVVHDILNLCWCLISPLMSLKKKKKRH
jgi:hypothetical protein